MADKVKVAVRVRPLNRREVDLGTRIIIEMKEDQTVIHHPSEFSQVKKPKTFAFDNCFWSCCVEDEHFADQVNVFNKLGSGVLENAFNGYNACIFAYGQTGSGKSYTMMGTPNDKGITPRLCDTLFEQIRAEQSAVLSFKVEVSYMEIYNEKVRDLLDPKGTTKHHLRVREHNVLGPYVDGLSALAVSSFEQIQSLMEEGNKSRTVAATNMNSESSRSHAVFNITVTQSLNDRMTGLTSEKVSKISLVDLAGSERAQKTGAIGDRLKEGSNINKSLTTLGLVISALAEQSSGKGKNKFVPYRDSVLTWLLKDNLGGNSRTIMVATISPSADNYEESLSTLRYADRAKRIEQHAVVNEDPNARIIRELKEEVEALRAMLKDQNEAGDLRERLQETEKMMQRMSLSWTDRLQETEEIHRERQQALETMGISVQASGIKVEQGKFYLVNLNADPSLNELLVYYLKEKTLIGRPDACIPQDIQLQGLGIMPQHAIISLEKNELFVEPLNDARTCVNGSVIGTRTQLRNGDRVLWGNNHFFRVNCPGAPSANQQHADDKVIDYEFAREELIMHEMGNNPISQAVKALEKHHEEEKQAALENQRQMYERQIQLLKMSQFSPGTPMTPSGDFFLSPSSRVSTPSGSAFPNSKVQAGFVVWAQEREETFKKGLARLKEDIVRGNAMVREANSLSQDLRRSTTYSVTLQIPAANLTPKKLKSGGFVSEPAILVKRKGKGTQIWSMEKLENKLVDMREVYQEWKEGGEQALENSTCADPFFESQENHNLIGVANVFLEVLFHNVKLDYHVPIITQQGEVAGRLHVEIYRVKSEHKRTQQQGPSLAPATEVATEATEDSNEFQSDSGVTPSQSAQSLASSHNSNVSETALSSTPESFYGSTITCRVAIKKASGLPVALSNFVFCQYNFWGHPDPVVVPPAFDSNNTEQTKQTQTNGVTYLFDHEKDFKVTVTDEFLEHVQESALPIEVWGHKSGGFSNTTERRLSTCWDVQSLNAAKSRSLQDRWAEVTSRLELSAEILEINDSGVYTPVPVNRDLDVPTGGVYQIRQGQQKRLRVSLRRVKAFHGILPFELNRIVSVSVGCISLRSKTLQKALDSYQEEDLNILRDRWSDALSHRREYLDDQIQRLMQKPDKSEEDVEREQALIAQWVALTEERNAVLVPMANSGVPGAPAEWDPPPGMEKHVSVIFLDMNAEDMGATAALSAECLQAAGINSLLPKEHGGKMFQLPILKHSDHEVCAVASWDSSIHEHPALMRLTQENERVYCILKVIVRISNPTEMEIVLRKRLCLNVIKKVGFAQRFFRRLAYHANTPTSCGVMFDIVSNIPMGTEDPESRETLALFAARPSEGDGVVGPPDGESYIEKYTKGISAVESILALDRLRQEVAIKELLAAQKRKPKKSSSLPEGFIVSGDSRLDRRGSGQAGVDKSVLARGVGKRRKRKRKLLKKAGQKMIESVSSLVSPVGGGLSKSGVPTAKWHMNPIVEDPTKTTNVIGRSDGRTGSLSASATVESIAKGLGGSEDVPSAASSGYGSQALSLLQQEASSESSQNNSREKLGSGSNETKCLDEREEPSSPIEGSEGAGSESDVFDERLLPEDEQNLSDYNGNITPAEGSDTASTIHDGEAQETQESPEKSSDLSDPTLLSNSSTTSSSGTPTIMNQSTYSDYGAKLEPVVASPDAQTSVNMQASMISTNASSDALRTSVISECDETGSQSDKASATSEGYAVPSWMKVGAKVHFEGRTATIQYLGSTEFASGIWVGLSLEYPEGKHNGCVQGIQYFTCKAFHGLFVRPDKIVRIRPNRTGGSSVKKPPRPPTTAGSVKQQVAARRGLFTSTPSQDRQMASPHVYARRASSGLAVKSDSMTSLNVVGRSPQLRHMSGDRTPTRNQKVTRASSVLSLDKVSGGPTKPTTASLRRQSSRHH